MDNYSNNISRTERSGFAAGNAHHNTNNSGS